MAPKFVFKPSSTRGHAHHGWLKTYHHFPFASYFDPSNQYQDALALRVINEDRVTPGEGFGTHGHSDFEIFSYIVSGELEHKDSLGNLEIMKRGDLQMTSTGTGVRHSEYNRNPSKEVHFLQIWAKPYQSRLPVKYYNRAFTDAEKTNKLVKIVAPVEDADVTDEREGKGPIPIHSKVRVFASILNPSETLQHATQGDTKFTLIHNIMSSGYRKPADKAIDGGAAIKVSNGADETHTLEEGDSLYIDGKLTEELKIESSGAKDAEFLVFEMY